MKEINAYGSMTLTRPYCPVKTIDQELKGQGQDRKFWP